MSVYTIVDNMSPKMDMLPNKLKNINYNTSKLFSSNQINEDIECIIQHLNIVSQHMYNSYNNLCFVDLYDNISALYLCSNEIEQFWNNISQISQINIKIINGSNCSFKLINEVNFIEGINILAGCSTKKLAIQLNNKLNCEHKYFVGFNGIKHNFGYKFYICDDNYSEINKHIFNAEWEKLKDEYPIIKIIKIFEKMVQADSTNIHVIDKHVIINKINDIKEKIKNNKKLNSHDSYFRRKYSCKYTDQCEENNDYIMYFLTYLNLIHKKHEIQQKKRKLIFEQNKTELEEIKYYHDITLSGTIITSNYEKFFTTGNKSKLFSEFNLCKNKHNIIIDNKEKCILLFFKNNNIIYFLLKSVDDQNIAYFDTEINIVDDEGYQYEHNYEYI